MRWLGVFVVGIMVFALGMGAAIARPPDFCLRHPNSPSCQTTSSTTTTTTTTPPSGNVLWRGDYETGDFSQWWLRQWAGGDNTPAQVGNTTATIVSSPVQQGRYAARFQINDTTGSGAPNDRAEVLSDSPSAAGTEGLEWYYGWWTLFPGPTQTFWSNGDSWNDITQFQSPGAGGWFYFGIDATRTHVSDTAIYYTGPAGHAILVHPLQFDHWYHFIAHIRFSTGTGFVQVFIDGNNVYPLTNQQTLNPGNPQTRISQGFYRHILTTPNTVIHDGFCRADTYAAAASC